MSSRAKVISSGCLLVSVLAVHGQAKACQYHDGLAFSPFGAQHFNMQRHKSIESPGSVTLNHADSSNIKVNTTSYAQLSYRAPSYFSDVTLSIMPSENITLMQDAEVTLNKVAGLLIVKYKATEPGEHEIKFQVKAVREGVPQVFVQAIKVVAS